MGLDNLREQCSLPFQEFAANVKPKMQLAYTPENSTDLCAVTDYDLGRLDKKAIRDQFYNAFNDEPDEWVLPGDEGGVSESDFRVYLTKWQPRHGRKEIPLYSIPVQEGRHVQRSLRFRK